MDSTSLLNRLNWLVLFLIIFLVSYNPSLIGLPDYDKIQHFLLSIGLVFLFNFVIKMTITFSVLIVLSICVAKEILDSYNITGNSGYFSIQDIYADLLGIASAVIFTLVLKKFLNLK